MKSTSDNTKESLIAAGIQLFAKNGFDGVSVKEIAAQAGVNVSLVSYHFDGKEGLYRSCLAQFGRERLAVVEKLLQPPSTAEELRIKLGVFVDEVLTKHAEQPDVCQLIHNEAEKQDPIIQDIFEQTFLKAFDTFVTFFKVAQQKKLIKAECKPIFCAAALYGMIFQFGKNSHISERHYGISIKEPKGRKAVADEILRIFLDGVLI